MQFIRNIDAIQFTADAVPASSVYWISVYCLRDEKCLVAMDLFFENEAKHKAAIDTMRESEGVEQVDDDTTYPGSVMKLSIHMITDLDVDHGERATKINLMTENTSECLCIYRFE